LTLLHLLEVAEAHQIALLQLLEVQVVAGEKMVR
jgi:hypothetical protein